MLLGARALLLGTSALLLVTKPLRITQSPTLKPDVYNLLKRHTWGLSRQSFDVCHAPGHKTSASLVHLDDPG